MVKIVVLLISLGVGSYFGYFFNQYINNVFVDILIAFLFFIATILCLIVLFFVVLFFACFFEKKDKQREYQLPYFRKLLYVSENILFSLFGMKLHCNGIDKLSIYEQYVVVSNHRSNLDSLVIDRYLKRYPLTFVAKDSLFKIPFTGQIIHGCAYLKLYRDNITSEYETFELAHKMLTRDEKPLSVGIFPEGTRNKSDDATSVGEFKSGSFRMAKKANCPIVISCLRGTKEVNNNLLFKRHHVYFDIIKVISYDQYKDWDLNQISAYCHNEIQSFLKENDKK